MPRSRKYCPGWLAKTGFLVSCVEENIVRGGSQTCVLGFLRRGKVHGHAAPWRGPARAPFPVKERAWETIFSSGTCAIAHGLRSCACVQLPLQLCWHSNVRTQPPAWLPLALSPPGRLTSKTALVVPPATPAATGSSATPGQASQASFVASEAREAKRPRAVAACIQELKDLKALLDAGVLTAAEFERLKSKLFAES